MSPITVRRENQVAIVASDSPPVNALGAAVRQGIFAAVEAAERDPQIVAIVILCKGKTFFAGADISEFGRPHADPILPVLVDRIESCSKPVVAAMHGTALGGGLELALACHYRIAVPATRLGLPEVKLGLIPGAGGTQRLPRLIGATPAMEMIAFGEPVSADAAAGSGLIDRVVNGDLETAAVSYAREIADIRPLTRNSQRQDRLGDSQDFETAATQFRRAHARKLAGRDAPEYAVRAVAASFAASYAKGLQVEHDLFWELMRGTQARAQQYLFFAERQAAKIDGISPAIQPRKIGRVGIVGAGTMGSGIAVNFLSVGIPVILVESSASALERGRASIQAIYEREVAKGRTTRAQLERTTSLLGTSLELSSLAECDLVIEAVFEDMGVKKQVFRQLDSVCRRGCLLASNTSFLNIDALAAETTRPGDVLGLHFFSPANVMKLLEVVRGANTAPDVLLSAVQTARQIGKIPVIAGVCHGFIGNRMLMVSVAQTDRLILEGATPQQIDRVHVEFGMPMGPFRTADLAGLDLGWHRDPARSDTVIEALCALGRWGQKTRRGYYDYDENRNPTPSAEVQEVIERFRTKAAIAPREISDQEIIERSLYTLVNEGAKVLEEGIAQRAADIDVVWACGYGWPRHKGGPMFWADTEGLRKVISGLERQRTHFGASFTISAALERAAVNGTKLADLTHRDITR